MNEHKIQIAETFAILIVYVIAYFLITKVINNALKNAQLQRARRKMIIKAVHLFASITVVIFGG